ncbi:disintegrin and metalloproteinase domain-containing protein 26A-like [Peromyscus eremicus]|uniref:disintegrin and metalloproteinase domain-containing protein 26A-like n=1 Tax=Peromyscus eremicus TaxID=42410 RepID=UPI0027DD81D0|nr:disintegrin and metalloproteinase domain-containing protein 26A-like [Peromyscus eremicus]XP_059100823.1 disintegrin and metalloproteinase domain-containing protein 26A-like [Peromyscus eremicus]
MFLQLCLWMLLLLSAWSPTVHARYSSPPEVVIPLRITDPSTHDVSPDWLSYSLRFGGERHIITMKPTKYFVSRNFLLFTYTDQDDLLVEQPFVQNDCYYHGYVDGEPESMLIINTCFGSLQGIIEINGTVYEIMPKNQTSTFEHLVYKIDSEDSESFSMRCGLTDEEIARQMKIQESKDSTLMQSQYENWWTHHKYLEYYVAVDNKRYVYKNNNVTACMQEMLQVVNGINGYYLQIDIEVVLTTLEVWTQTNHVNVSESIGIVLSNFCAWKRSNIDNRIRNDIAHLFARQGYGMYLGLAYVGTICSNSNCAVNSFTTDSLQSMAFIIAHEMGHNLGMHHDDKFCTCGLSNCIMAAYQSNSPRFSNCSYENMYSVINRRNCLYNIPDIEVKLNLTSCGNSLVEEGEQCDCGSSESCQSDACCTEECVFKPDAECAFGLCCKDCKFIPAGTVCREKKNECDLPEWCHGTSAECPEDVYMEDGTSCGDDGYCYNKTCPKRKEHCQSIFGDSAKSADETCYMEMNRRGDRFGNCGNDSRNYRRCNNTDVLCGRIQCENVEEIPQRRNHETVHWTHFNDVTCWSTDYHFGITTEDVGAVRDGTTCGPSYMCIDRKCIPNPFLFNNCSAQCNNQGVCNNKQHCHCDEEWEPPDCLLSGYGGSIDSGPAPKIERRRKRKSRNLMLPLLILFLVLLFLLACLITRRKSDQEIEPEQMSETKPEPDEPGSEREGSIKIKHKASSKKHEKSEKRKSEKRKSKKDHKKKK